MDEISKEVDKIIPRAHFQRNFRYQQTLPGFLPKESFSDLSISMAGYYEKAMGHYCKRDLVPEYQVAYCTGGRGVICCEGKRSVIGKGDIFINIPGHAHEYWADDKEPWSHYWVHFVGSSAPRYFHHMQCRPDEPGFSLGHNDRLVDLYKEMLALLPHEDTSHQIHALSVLHNILSTIIVLRRQAKAMIRAEGTGVNLDMAALDHYIERHLTHVSLPDLAAFSAVSVPHFVRVFTRTTGYTPMQYVARRKINRACRTLVGDTTLRIKEVAGSAGIDDPHYFSRLFKKVTGMTPLQYRRMSIR